MIWVSARNPISPWTTAAEVGASGSGSTAPAQPARTIEARKGARSAVGTTDRVFMSRERSRRLPGDTTFANPPGGDYPPGSVLPMLARVFFPSRRFHEDVDQSGAPRAPRPRAGGS